MYRGSKKITPQYPSQLPLTYNQTYNQTYNLINKLYDNNPFNQQPISKFSIITN